MFRGRSLFSGSIVILSCMGSGLIYTDRQTMLQVQDKLIFVMLYIAYGQSYQRNSCLGLATNPVS